MPHPNAAHWLELHVQFIQGNFDAWNEIAEYFLPWLSQRLSDHRLGGDEHLANESAENALLDYRRNPQRFDTTRGVFLGYWLWIQARGHLSHLRRSKRRRQAKEKAIGTAHMFLEKKLAKMKNERAICIGGEEEVEKRQRVLESLLSRLTLCDQVGVDLLRRGGTFQQWVDHLKIADLSIAEQRQTVNAERARLKKKLRRLIRNRRLGRS